VSERDTQFASFAHLLWEELPDVPENHYEVRAYDKWSDECEQIIARRAYDLACHVATHTVLTAYGDMIKIPDMTTLPEVKSE
jgi:hypothetical protein